MLTVGQVLALLVFLGAYVLFALRERYRVLVAGVGAALLLATGVVPIGRLLPTGFAGDGSLIEWNTLGLLAGLFLFAGLLAEVGFLRWAADRLTRRTGGRPLRLLLALSALSFVLSAFVNSITVLLVLAAITIEIARSARVDPVPLLLAEISAANAGGASTFIGDPPNVIFGTYFHLSFADFALHTGLPALAALGVLLLWFGRGMSRDAPAGVEAPSSPAAAPTLSPGSWGAVLTFGAVLVVLAAQGPLGLPVWLVGLSGGALALLLAGPARVRAVLRRFDAETLAFFLCLFVLVGGLVTTGLLSSWAGSLAGATHDDAVVTGSLLMWVFALISAFVDNVPLAAAAAPFLALLSGDSGLAAAPLVYASSLGTDLGGNGSPIGASANVVGLAVARREGVTVGWPQYLRRCFPAMLASVAAANLVWLVVR